MLLIPGLGNIFRPYVLKINYKIFLIYASENHIRIFHRLFLIHFCICISNHIRIFHCLFLIYASVNHIRIFHRLFLIYASVNHIRIFHRLFLKILQKITILSKNHSLSGQEIQNISKTSKGDFHQEHFTGK